MVCTTLMARLTPNSILEKPSHESVESGQERLAKYQNEKDAEESAHTAPLNSFCATYNWTAEARNLYCPWTLIKLISRFLQRRDRVGRLIPKDSQTVFGVTSFSRSEVFKKTHPSLLISDERPRDWWETLRGISGLTPAF